MKIAFVIWTAVAVLFLFFGIQAGKSEAPVGFWANAKVPEIRDVKAYNRAVSVLWFVFAAIYELLGLPFLFCGQNSPVVFVSIIGTMFLVIGIMIAYTRIEATHKK